MTPQQENELERRVKHYVEVVSSEHTDLQEMWAMKEIKDHVETVADEAVAEYAEESGEEAESWITP